ncbi:MAG: molybdopterin-dependent oxidoreductase, partial [Spirosoma sp.]|nr:molybdopterin-dependent oxidoreductase [Spirosoma sp.]
MTTNTPPEELTGQLTVGEPKAEAAGVTAVIKSFQHVLEGTGPVRGWTALVNLNQKDGFDCPSCAWPDPDHDRSSIAEYCESGAKAVADEVMTKHTASPVLFQRYSVTELLQKTDLWLGQQGRLTKPMRLQPGATHYEPIEWADAFQLIADELNALASPDEAIFYTSGRTSNEAAFLYQLFVRMFGTNNMPDCSNMCHESSGSALNPTIGIGKGTVSLEDIHNAELIFVVGQNPGTNHPRMLSALADCKSNGGKIVAVNPLPEAGLFNFRDPQTPAGVVGKGVDLADEFLQIKVGADLALFQAL